MTSRYCPPIIPIVARASSRAISGGSHLAASPNASAEERVAGEERHGLSEGDVDARPTPPLVVVVERRQVVVDERERVDELERGRGLNRVLRVRARRLADRKAEHRPDPLAAPAERVANRLLQGAERRVEA